MGGRSVEGFQTPTGPLTDSLRQGIEKTGSMTEKSRGAGLKLERGIKTIPKKIAALLGSVLRQGKGGGSFGRVRRKQKKPSP